ncbi:MULTISPECIES: restriction endonuclease subunit S [Bacteroidaceae]|uniref:restriction endonuclease subunit S n=2 Tax=Bacteroidaceae TaxID=815 RepID=UPI001C21C184|nr:MULTISPECIES: restriction endonuclease subunit S [Bacteroidaceae]MBU8974112.1 restriction endonuclease subunit S [Bacteroides eggerthii]MBU8996957.1 restriction endonuclease subunit S [Bacteroides eggerthii]MCB6663600.1 restriction endonuclease subunit S [Phocaeicola dorei]MCG4758413.1 restriction endonuclease subunit S [Bacteroides eggerthii]
MADNKDKKVLNVPALRFPEFTGEWKSVHLEDVAEFQKKRISSDLLNNNNYISTENILQNFEGIQYSSSIPTNTNVIEYQKGDILLSNIRPYLKKVWFSDRKGGCSADVFVLRGDKCDQHFLYYVIASDRFINYVMSGVKGVKMPRGDKNQMKKYAFSIPTNTEQRKIAKFLSMLDERIKLQNKIIEKYESLIQAIIYKEKMDGISKGTWQRIALCKVLQERNEKNVNGRTICSVSVSLGVVNQVEYLGRSFAAKQTSHYNIVKYGDIVYTKSPTGNFPYGIIKRSNIREDVAVSPLYGVYIPASDSIGVFLHFYFMQPSNAFNYLHPLIQKGAKNTINITNGRFLENSVPLPISRSETNTIAGILKTIQTKIEIEKNLLQSYTKEKKYLLRQMFI